MPDTLIFVAIRKAAVNHLKNGGFLDLPRQYTPVNNFGCLSIGDVPGITRVLKTSYRYSRYEFPGFSRPVQTQLTAIDIPGCYVQSTAPTENFFAYWDVWGIEGLVGVNASGYSLDGGNKIDVHFSVTGKIYFKQAVESFDKFRGKPVTFALSGYSGKGDVKVTFSVDTGTVQTGRSFYSRYFGPYTRMVQPFQIPTNATKFEVIVTMEGGKEAFASFSGAMLVLGEYTSDLPFSESPADKAVPSGMTILWAGESCPAGYRSVGDEVYLLQTIGDPNAFLGDLMNANTVNKQVIGFNQHGHAAEAATEQQPSAFDTRFSSFATPAVEESGAPIRSVQPSPTPGDEGSSTTYEGVRETALPMSHSHLVQIGGTMVEPPRIKVRICEKI